MTFKVVDSEDQPSIQEQETQIQEEFEQRTDPRGTIYYWLTGKFKNYDHQTDTDEWALANGYVSIVPVQFDLTNYKAMDVLQNNWNLNN
jgi:5'-nucleotidase